MKVGADMDFGTSMAYGLGVVVITLGIFGGLAWWLYSKSKGG